MGSRKKNKKEEAIKRHGTENICTAALKMYNTLF